MCALAILAAISVLGMNARGATVDLSGQVIKSGGSIGGVSSTTVPPALLYDVSFTGSGNATGDLVYATGTDSPSAILNALFLPNPQTLDNLTGKLPHTICAKTFYNYLYNVPLTSSTQGNLSVRAYVKLSIDRKGYVHANASKFAFSARGLNNRKVTFTGTYVFAAGSGFTVVPTPAQDNVPTPNILFPWGALAFSGSLDVRVSRNSSKTTFFILQNEDTNTDSYTLVGEPITPAPMVSGTLPPPKPYYSATVYDGTNNITNDVFTKNADGYQIAGPGYQIPNLPGGGTKLIKTIIRTGSKATGVYSQGIIGFVLESATNAAINNNGAFDVYVP